MDKDKLYVINLALMKVGLPLAATLNDADYNASLTYDHAVECVLREFPWGFATKFATLSQASAAKPPFGYDYAYSLPADYIRLVDVHAGEDLRSPKARFNLSDGHIYANVTPCNCRYVALINDPAKWPVDFLDAVACWIAYQISNLSAQAMGLSQNLIQMYNLSLAKAQAIDATETIERAPYEEGIAASRHSGGTQPG